MWITVREAFIYILYKNFYTFLAFLRLYKIFVKYSLMNFIARKLAVKLT